MATIADEPRSFTGLSAQMKMVLALLLFAALVRGGVLWARFEDLTADPDGYREIAEAVQRWKLFARKPHPDWPRMETAYRPPLYPYALVALAGNGTLKPLRIALLHGVLGVATVLLTYYLAQVWGLSRNVAFLGAVLVILDPILLRQSSLVMTETLATFVAALTLVALTRFSARPDPFEAALVGLALGASALCRPTFIPFAAVALMFMRWVPAPRARQIVNVVVALLMMMVVTTPWVYRNWVDLGNAVVSTTHGGYTLALGNNPDFYAHLRGGGWQTPWDVESSRLPRRIDYHVGDTSPADHWEVRHDHAAYMLALASIREDPAMFAVSCVYRAWRFWSPLAMQLSPAESRGVRLVRYAAAIWYVAVFALAVVGVRQLGWRLWRTPWLWGVLLCLSFSLVHTFFWSDMRMRAPLMPVVALLAASGFAALAPKLLRRAKSPAKS